MKTYDNIRDTTGTCEGCPLTIVCFNGKCPDYCKNMAEWLENHDKQVKNDAIKELYDYLFNKTYNEDLKCEQIMYTIHEYIIQEKLNE